jgi:hypothetical protein
LNQRTRTVVTALALGVAGICLYATGLEWSPPYLANDEVTQALTAHSLASTGRDLEGRAWPLYIQMTAGSWYSPMEVYLLALALKVLPFSEATIRLPTACIGVLNIVLMYFVGCALFKREALAILAALMLALTPAHFLLSRFALECVYPLPFVLGWLFFLIRYLDDDRPGFLLAGTMLIGFSFYSYIAAVAAMPLHVGITILALALSGKPARAYGVAFAGFVFPLVILFVPWLVLHRAAPANTVGHYLIYDTTRFNPLQGLREILSYVSMVERTSLYWEYLNPSFMFLDQAGSFAFSTRTAGVFLVSMALFMPVGLYHAFRSGGVRHTVLLLGFLTAPMVAALIVERFAIHRALELLPFGVLLAVVGVQYLWSGPRVPLRRIVCVGAGAAGVMTGLSYAAWTMLSQGRVGSSTLILLMAGCALVAVGIASDSGAARLVVVGAVVALPIQFSAYLHDYFTEYRSRAAEVLRLNRKGGLEYIIERAGVEHTPAIYLSGEIEGIERYWKVYLVKHEREDLLSRTVVFTPRNPLEVNTIPQGSAVMAPVNDPATTSLVESGALTRETVITEPGGRPSIAILRR